MIGHLHPTIPRAGALWHGMRRVIETIFHIGAHRCATTTFQAYLDRNRRSLIRHGLMPWTPHVTRDGVLDRLVRPPGHDDDAHDADIARRVAARRAALNRRGMRQLLVSEENMIGTPRDNLVRGLLYPGLIPRLARFQAAFAGQVDRIGLVIRSYDGFWSSSLAFAVMAGHPVPDAATCARLADQPRTWVDVVQDLRRLFPTTPLHVWTFESFAGRPRRQLGLLVRDPDLGGLPDQQPVWANRSRDTATLRDALIRQGRGAEAAMIPSTDAAWMPFTAAQRAACGMLYADDLTALRTRDDPLFTLTERAAIMVPSIRCRATGG